MNDELVFSPAGRGDIAAIMEIIRAAQEQMRRAGSDQWQNGYPAAADIERDIAMEWGCVLRHEGRVVAYGAVIFTGEPAYNAIEGAWHTSGEYVVLHRLAVAEGRKRRGIAARYFGCVAEQARRRGVAAFRVDTAFDNRIMLHLLERLGFARCGIIRYQSGERIAFDMEI